MFFGRKEELNLLKDKFNSKKTESIIVYGRRRIGKSRLVFEALKDSECRVVSYECFNTSSKDNLIQLTKEVSKVFNNDYLNFETIKDLMLFMAEQSKKTKSILFIDEYPLMRNGKETDSLIKNALDSIDVHYSDSNFKIILCGSSIDVMSVLDNPDMPLHGRFTSNINLRPLDYYDSSLFYPKANNQDKVLYYSVFGGVPYFLKQIDDSKSFQDNICRLLIQENALLKTELNSEINSEINKIENASFVMDIIRNRIMNYSDIKQKFNNAYPNGSIDYVLNKLIALQVIDKKYFYANNNTKKPYYYICDNAFSYYYYFLNGTESKIRLYKPKDYYNDFIKDLFLTNYVPHKFEIICMQYIEYLNKNKLFPIPIIDLFPYIYNDRINKKSYEFDVVGQTKKGLINFECKYTNTPIAIDEIMHEQDQAKHVFSHFYKQAFISKSGFKKNAINKDYILYTLDDLFKR